jgi:hypothetical protein
VSFDLFAWNVPVPGSAVQGGELLDRFFEGDPETLGAGTPLQDFRAALVAEYPPLEDLAETEESPWAMTPSESDRLVEIHLVWSAGDAVLLRIVELAIQHGVVLYDPQGPDVHSPGGVSRLQLEIG